MKLSLILPVYNEEKIIKDSLKKIIKGVKKITLDFEIIVVENGSIDHTLKILKKHKKLTSCLKILHLPSPNLGLALKKGVEKSQGELVSFLYADLYNFSFLKKSLALSKSYDLIIGSKSKNSRLDKRPLFRKLITLSYNAFLKYYLGLKSVDNRGLKTFKRTSLLPIIKSSTAYGSLFDTELTKKSEVLGLKIFELPVSVKEQRPSRLGIIGWLKQTFPYLLTIRKNAYNYLSSRPCPSCQNQKVTLLYLKDSYKIVKCQKCSLVFLDAAFPQSFFKNFYNRSYFKSSNINKKGYENYRREEENIRMTSQQRLATLKKLIINSKILDIGCATGVFLEEAKKQGFDPYGIEISNYARRLAQKRLGKERVFRNYWKLEIGNWKFNVITLWDTLEHLPDPQKTLKSCRKLLKRNGLLAISTGDIDSLLSKIQGQNWHLLNPPQHLAFFSKKTLSNLLETTGFKVIKTSYEPQIVSLSYISHRLQSMSPRSLVAKILPLLSRFPPLSSSCLSINLYDILTIYTKK